MLQGSCPKFYLQLTIGLCVSIWEWQVTYMELYLLWYILVLELGEMIANKNSVFTQSHSSLTKIISWLCCILPPTRIMSWLCCILPPTNNIFTNKYNIFTNKNNVLTILHTPTNKNNIFSWSHSPSSMITSSCIPLFFRTGVFQKSLHMPFSQILLAWDKVLS